MPKAQTKATAPTPAPDTPLPVEYAVRIYPVKDSKYTLANANVDINGVFAIRGVKVIRGEKGPFVAMPQYKDSHGDYHDTEAVAAPPAVQDGDTGKKEAAAKERLERLKAKAEAQMEEIAPYLSDGFTDEEMYKALISKGRLDNRPCLKWRPVKDKL